MASKLLDVIARFVYASLVVLITGPAFGQYEQEDATAAPESGAWIAMVIVIILFVGVCAGCLTSPKRSHLD